MGRMLLSRLSTGVQVMVIAMVIVIVRVVYVS